MGARPRTALRLGLALPLLMAAELPPDAPTRLPDPDGPLPLLPVPSARPEPAPAGRTPGTGGTGEYDPNLFYLPDRLPESPKVEPCACGPKGYWWAGVEGLYWATRGFAVPPLLTSPPAGLTAAQVGPFDAPGTTLLAGDAEVNNRLRPGVRVSTGFMLDRWRTWAVEGSFFYLEAARDGGAFASAGSPPLARPFFDRSAGRPSARWLAAPGEAAGVLGFSTGTEVLGAEAACRRNVLCGDHFRLDLLAGYRFLGLNESLTVLDAHNDLTTGTVTLTQDRFGTQNQFHGGQVGAFCECRHGRAYLDVAGKVAFGMTYERFAANGGRQVFAPGAAPQTLPGGLLARPAALGTTTNADYAVVPEVALSLGYQVSDHVRAFAGYTFLYCTTVARPGPVVDLGLNPAPDGPLAGARLTGSTLTDRTNAFWVQGVNLGVEVRY